MTDSKYIFITGAASGIGRATATRFATEGWRVAAADLDKAGLESLRSELGANQCSVYALDVTNVEMFKGVIDDRARAVFQGRIVVHPKAQKADGHQLSKALLLSDRAEIDTKPELEIYADDVKCSHGAAVGDLDREALFYLRSRGIPEAAARNLLIEAFLAEAIQEIATEDLAPVLMTNIGRWLSSASRGAVQ